MLIEPNEFDAFYFSTVIRPLLVNGFYAQLKYSKTIFLLDSVDAPLSQVIPAHCSELRLGHLYDEPIQPGDIPDSVRTLILGHSFRSKVAKDIFPSHLEKLEFGYSYTHRLFPGLVPCTVKELTLGYMYNHSIDLDVLPAGLTHLTLGHCFQSKLAKGILPAGLTHLTLGSFYHHSIEPGLLPEGLTHLTLGYHFHWPLHFGGSLPKSLRLLKVGFHFVPCLQAGFVPAFVQNIHLVLPFKYIKTLDDSLPLGRITHLTFGSSFDARIQPGYIPEGVRYLVFGDAFQHWIEHGVIPDSVRYLFFGESFDCPLYTLPSKLSLIVVSENYPYLQNLHFLACTTQCTVFIRRGTMVYFSDTTDDGCCLDYGVDYEWFLQTIEELSLSV
jgi:FNIP Repeat